MPDYLYPILGAVLGLVIGSFLATIVSRWPEGKSVVSGRSRCDSCNEPLGALDLVPILSYLARIGKCAYCGSAIKTDYLVIELGAGLIGGIALFVAPGMAGLLGAIFGWILLTLAALDAQHHWLPDRLTLTLAVVGIASTVFVEEPDITDRLIGGGAGFLTLFLVGWSYHKLRGREGLGGGDPKLLGAIGCWLGWPVLPLVILGAAMAGLLAVFMTRIRGHAVTADSALPFGGFMAIAAFPIWIIQTMRGGSLL